MLRHAFLALCLVTASCQSTVEWVDYGANPMEDPQYLADMTAAGAVGPEHERLTALAGTWTVEGQTWMEPGGDPLPMNATARVEAVLGGRYTVEQFESEFMGLPFEGRLTQGYDNLRERYWCLWIDSMSTGYWITHGIETSPGTIEYTGTTVDILTPGGRPVRMTTTRHDDGHYTMRMFDSREGTGEFQSMELDYRRR